MVYDILKPVEVDFVDSIYTQLISDLRDVEIKIGIVKSMFSYLLQNGKMPLFRNSLKLKILFDKFRNNKFDKKLLQNYYIKTDFEILKKLNKIDRKIDLLEFTYLTRGEFETYINKISSIISDLHDLLNKREAELNQNHLFIKTCNPEIILLDSKIKELITILNNKLSKKDILYMINKYNLSNIFKENISNDKKMIFFFVDSLGFIQFKYFIKKSIFLSKLIENNFIQLKPYTSHFTTETAPASFSLFNGTIQHNIYSNNLYFDKIHKFNVLKLPSRGIYDKTELDVIEIKNELQVHNKNNLLNKLKNNNFRCIHIRNKRMEKSFMSKTCSLSKISHADSRLNSFKKLELEIKKNLGNNFFIELYYSNIDHESHISGPFSHDQKSFLNQFSNLFKNFIYTLVDDYSELFNSNTSIFLFGDHGMKETNKNKRINAKIFENIVSNEDKILAMGRTIFIYSDDNNVLINIKLKLKEKNVQFHVIENFELPCNNNKLKPNWIIYLNDDSIIETDFHFNVNSLPFMGQHGGWSVEELFIPLIKINLNDRLLKYLRRIRYL